MLHRSSAVRFARPAVAIAVLVGVAGASVIATHPAEAAATFASVAGAVTCATTGTTACQSYTNSSSGIAVSGTSAKGTGVRASSTSNYGIKSTSSTADAIFGQVTSSSSGTSVAGVAGTSPQGYGVYGYTSSDGIGVNGVSSNYVGVQGSTTSGSGFAVVGIETMDGTGLYGTSDSGLGAQTLTSTGTALYARATGTGGKGVSVVTDSGTGVSSQSSSGLAFYGVNSSGNAADLRGSYIGVVTRAPAAGYPILATDPSGNNLFYVDGKGNVAYHGGLYTFARTKSGATVSQFSARSSAPTVEDTGTAQLIGGAATVRLDPAFAATIDTTSPYRVFVTPGGDTRGLYVKSKTPQGFIVRESQAGRSTVTFDYRIVAASIGEGGKRMAMVSASGEPHAPVTPLSQSPADNGPLPRGRLPAKR